MSYWMIKTLLVTALIVVTYLVIRPVKTASSLAVRRLGMLVIMLAAIFAIIFPEVFNRFAHAIGVQNGTNLVVYLLVIAIFAQMATSYRRDAGAEARLTELARQVALQQSMAKECNRGCEPDAEDED